MRQSVINYVKENGIKLAANSKALKLKKSKSYWINSNTFNSLVLPKEAFPSVKWEDNEPTRVIIRLA